MNFLVTRIRNYYDEDQKAQNTWKWVRNTISKYRKEEINEGKPEDDDGIWGDDFFNFGKSHFDFFSGFVSSAPNGSHFKP